MKALINSIVNVRTIYLRFSSLLFACSIIAVGCDGDSHAKNILSSGKSYVKSCKVQIDPLKGLLLNEDFKDRLFECVARTYNSSIGGEGSSNPTPEKFAFDIQTSPLHTTHANLWYESDRNLMIVMIPLGSYESDPFYYGVRIDDPKVKTFLDSLGSNKNYTDFGRIVNWK